MKKLAFIVLIGSLACIAQVSQTSYGANSPNVAQAPGPPTPAPPPAQTKQQPPDPKQQQQIDAARAAAIKSQAGRKVGQQPQINPQAPKGTPVPLTEAEKLKVSLLQRDILVAKNEQGNLSKQYDMDSQKIKASNDALNEALTKYRTDHSLAADVPFDQDALQFVKPESK